MNALIMAGGSGSRFWPLSRQSLPKQFLSFSGDSPLIARTYARLESIAEPEGIYVVTSSQYSDLTRAHVPHLVGENLILEPFGKNTAACVGLSSVILKEKGKGEEAVAVCPADHFIGNEEQFAQIMSEAKEAALEGRLVVLGIAPTEPSPHYGYIEKGEAIEGQREIFKVKKFVEKPDRERAEKMLENGGYFWNAGIFVWTPDTILQAIEKHMPGLYEGLMEIQRAIGGDRVEQVTKNVYGRLDSIPIDVGVLERTDNLVMLPVEMDWCDVGSWSTLRKMLDRGRGENVRHGKSVALDCKDSLLWSSGRLVTAIGLDGIAVVETPHAVLVCSLDKDQDIKKLMELLEEQGYGDDR